METMAEMDTEDQEKVDVASLDGSAEVNYSAEPEERMMSVEQLKQEMFKSLRDSGTIEAIRAQLRRRFIEKLKQHGRKQAALDGTNNNDQDARERWRAHDQLIHGLIHEYLRRHDMEHTLAVFVPEIGGTQQWLSRDAIATMLRLPEQFSGRDGLPPNSSQDQPTPLLALLLQELQRRLAVATMASATQTKMDCHDHRLALENQLRRVENSYLAESASHKLDVSVQSFEERVLRYQREYDALCEKRLQEDLVRFQATELALMRVVERKKFDREMETLQTSLFQEHRERLQRLQDRERELEMAFSARKTELESSLFEARQRLFQEIEAVRAKQHDADARSNAESRHLVTEAKRLQLLEEKLQVREENLQAAVDGIVQEKQKAWQLERLRWQSDARDREERLVVREQEADKAVAAAKQAKHEMQGLRVEMAQLEAVLGDTQAHLAGANKTIAKLEAEKKLLLEDLIAKEDARSEDKHSMRSLSYENARLAAEFKTLQHEKSMLEDRFVEKSSEAKQLEAEARDLQQQLITLKLSEANAVSDERKKLMQILDNERHDARWKENDLVGKLLELQTRLAESEASRDKFQTQYDDERVHVESLRQEVSSLHALLAQTQSAVAVTRQPRELRGSLSSARHGESSDSTGERMLMRMMEMMTHMHMHSGAANGSSRTSWAAPEREVASPTIDQGSSLRPPPSRQEEDEETKQRAAEQERRERELLDEREYKRRIEAEQREQQQRRKLVEDEQLARAKREQELEDDRRRHAAEQEARFQEQQLKQIQEAREIEKKLLDEQIAQEQKKLQEERLRDDDCARAAREEADASARRLQRLQDERQEKERQRLAEEEDEATAATLAQLREQQHTVDEEAATAVETQDTAEPRDTTPRVVVSSILDEPAIADERRPREEIESDDSAPPTRSLEAAVRESVAMGESAAPAYDASDNTGSYHSGNEASVTSETSQANEATLDAVSSDKNAADAREMAPPHDQPPAHATVITDDGCVLTHATAPSKSEDELEEERRQAAEAAKKKEDEATLDVFRQRVLARRAAEKQRQQELEEQQKREQEERARAEVSEDEMEDSGGSFASSAASSSGSF